MPNCDCGAPFDAPDDHEPGCIALSEDTPPDDPYDTYLLGL